MTPQQLEKRKRVMQRSIALGHCICDVRKPCPCDVFKDQGVCHCAGEKQEQLDGPVRLTAWVRNAGCASKIDKSTLRQALAGLPQIDDPRVLVGASAGDDAGVILLSSDTATVLTVDVFCPAVDDPYTFGQIAAANSLSDIYAMGATPQVALSIVGFPVHQLPASAMADMLRGGVDKMHEAGVCVIGGHSINDDEIKCGFAVVGTCKPAQVARNTGAKPGDVIVLTKPLGSGIAAFALQIGRVTDAEMEPIARSMATLNRVAGEALGTFGAHAATDVTGFSLLGHMIEIVKNSGVLAELDFDAIPLFHPIRRLATQDVLPGAVERNRESLEGENIDLSALAPAQAGVLMGPETSGGILAFLPADRAEACIDHLRANQIPATVIGKVVNAQAGGMIRVTTKQAIPWSTGAGKRQKDKGKREDPDTTPEVAGQRPADAPSNEQPGCCAPSPASCCASTPTMSCCAAPAAQPPASSSSAGTPLPPPAAADAFKAYMQAAGVGEALGLKTSKLIALALSILDKCEPCVRINADAARRAGASEQEIAEAIALGIAFGGAPTAMFYNMLRQKS